MLQLQEVAGHLVAYSANNSCQILTVEFHPKAEWFQDVLHKVKGCKIIFHYPIGAIGQNSSSRHSPLCCPYNPFNTRAVLTQQACCMAVHGSLESRPDDRKQARICHETSAKMS